MLRTHRRHFTPALLDQLEPRLLLSAYADYLSAPGITAFKNLVLLDNGTGYVIGTAADQHTRTLFQFDQGDPEATLHAITLPAGDPEALVLPDGTFLTSYTTDNYSVYHLAHVSQTQVLSDQIEGMTRLQPLVGSMNGTVWFKSATFSPNGVILFSAITALTPSGQHISVSLPLLHPSDPNAYNVLSSATAADGSLWLVTPSEKAIFHVQTDGSVTRYDVPGPTQVFAYGTNVPSNLSLAPDGAVWFEMAADFNPSESYVGRLDPLTGNVTTYGGLVHGFTVPMVIDQQGMLWGNFYGVTDILAEYDTATLDPTASWTNAPQPVRIWRNGPLPAAVAPDGTLWVQSQDTFGKFKYVPELRVDAAELAVHVDQTVTTAVGLIHDDAGGQPADYTATINWGDGTTEPGQITTDADGNLIVVGTHKYIDFAVNSDSADSANYQLTVTVSDATNREGTLRQASMTASVDVQQTPEHPWVHTIQTSSDMLVAAPGSTISGVLGHFVDTLHPEYTAADYSFSAAPVTGPAPMDLHLEPDGQGGFNLIGTLAVPPADNAAWLSGGFLHSGVVINARDGRGNTADLIVLSQTGELTLGGIAGTADMAHPDAAIIVGYLADAHAAAADSYTVTIDWGDGTTSPGWLKPNGPDVFAVYGRHAFAQAGFPTWTVTVTAADDRSATHAFAGYVRPVVRTTTTGDALLGRFIVDLTNNTQSVINLLTTSEDENKQLAPINVGALNQPIGTTPAAIAAAQAMHTGGTTFFIGEDYTQVSYSLLPS